MTEVVVGERRGPAIGCYDEVGVPQRLPDTLHHLNPLVFTESLDSSVSLLPDRLAVLVKAESLDIEVFADRREDLDWLPLHHVELPPAVPQLGVDVFHALQQEGNLVKLAVVGGRGLAVEDKYWKQLSSLVFRGFL